MKVILGEFERKNMLSKKGVVQNCKVSKMPLYGPQFNPQCFLVHKYVYQLFFFLKWAMPYKFDTWHIIIILSIVKLIVVNQNITDCR